MEIFIFYNKKILNFQLYSCYKVGKENNKRDSVVYLFYYIPMNIIQKHINHCVLYVLLIIVITKICPLNDSKNITNTTFNSTKNTVVIPHHEHPKNADSKTLTDVEIENDDETPDYEFTFHFHQLAVNQLSIGLFTLRSDTFYTHLIPKVYLTLFTPPPEV